MATTLVNYLDNYKYFVTKNPLLANEIEVALKWMSYIAAGRFSRSTVVTELIHSVSNLLALVNDSILRKAAGIPVHVNVAVEKLQTLLAVIEYSEVFAEVAARRISGSQGKWLVIASIQFVKTVIRILLILKYDQGLQHSPPIKPLNRRRDLPQLCEGDGNQNTAANVSRNVEVTFKLKRSGRAVRTLDTAPPLVSRTWQLPKEDENMQLNRLPSKLTEEYLAGEVLHVCRPLVHLLSLQAFGEFSWKPWIIALGMDATSLNILRKSKNFNQAEKFEINRRALSLILYLLRSPFYDKYSKYRIVTFLKSIIDNVIGSGLILRPLMEYIPEVQQIYFYTWSL